MASVPFNNLITFSRGSNATLTGPDGLIQWAPNNLLTFSEQFDNAAWAKSDTTVSANAIAAPDGTTTADLLTEGSAGTAVTSQTVSNSGPTIANSIYIKAGTATWVRFRLTSGANALSVWLNIATGALGTNSVSGTAVFVSATVTALASGWYQITFVGTIPAVTLYSFTVNSATADGSSTRTNAATYYLWGAQLELGSAATTYNSTTVKNLLGFSEAFDNAAWTKTRASIVTGAQANPVNGAFNAQKLMEDTTASNTHLTAQTATVSSAARVTGSIYVKAAERTRVTVQENTSGATVTVNLLDGSIISGSGTVQSAGNGWYRVSITTTVPGTSAILAIYLRNDTSTSYTGDGNSGVYIYGAQLSDSASLDPYVPTPAAAPSSTAYYGPRFDYDPVTLAPKGLLVEEARTNLVLRSAEFDNATWTVVGATVSANVTVSPDGASTADRLNASAGSGTHAVYTTSGMTVATGTNATSTVYVKKGTHRFVYITQTVSTNNNIVAVFDLDGGGLVATQTGAGSLSGTIVSTSQTNAGNGWFRLSITGSVTGATRFFVMGFATAATGNTISIDGNVTYTAAGTETFFLYGAQLEAGAFATSYIPTVASTVTRSADVATINGSLFSQWYGQTAGTFVVQFTPDEGLVTNINRVLTVSQAGAAARVIDINYFNTSWVNYNGTATTTIGAASVTATPQRIATAYASANYGYVLNGGTVATDTSALVNSPTQMAIGNTINVNQLNGHIRSIDYIPARAADFQLQALTELPLVPTLDLDFLNNLYEA